MVSPGARFGPYEVTGSLGAGGMGEVYRARDHRLERDVALKVLRDDRRLDAARFSRFKREARLLASLNHPNIATILGIEAGASVEAIVMELVEGVTLGDRIARGPLPVAEALPIARQIVAALDAAHKGGIVHRDLKPDNVMVRVDGTVKVLDFGLAKPLRGEEGFGVHATTISGPATHMSGVMLGTARYMSPEQIRRDSVDWGADIWAFGCVLYEMLAGRPAFPGDRTAEVLARILEREPDLEALPRLTPPAVRRLLRRCLEKDPHQRLRAIADAGVELQDDGGRRAGEVARHSGPARRPYVWPAIAAALPVALGLLAASPLWRWTEQGPREYVLDPPPGTVFGSGAVERTPAFAVSPDGTRLVFGATDASGRRALWLRELRSFDARLLAGTDNASDAFWAPDGLSIGFFADGMVKTLTVGGGTLQTVAAFPPEVTPAAGATAGGTWSRHGQIVFAPSPKSRLYRVPASGGAPVPITELQPGDTGHVRPQFLPDGRHLQYLVTAEATERRGIHLGAIDAPDSRLILPTVVRALYAPPGYLLSVRNGHLEARRFDATTHELGDDVFSVADSVAHITTEGRASFDASATGTLVFRESGVLATSQPAVVDGKGNTLAAVAAPGDYQTLGLSPDGVRLAVERHDPRTSTGDLWIVNLNDGSSRQMTFDGIHHNAALFSPSGTQLVFTGRPGGVRNLHLMDARSGQHEPLLPSGADRNPTDWSHEGWILYEENNPGTQFDLWALEMPARTPVRLLSEPFNERSARLSPDGRLMAYVSDRSGRPEVFVRPFRDRAASRETRVSVTGGVAPRWSADGRQLFFYGRDEAIVVVDVLAVDPFSAGRPVQLFAEEMRYVCGAQDPLRCPAPPVSWEVLEGGTFLINPAPPELPARALPLRVVENWTARLTAQTTAPP